MAKRDSAQSMSCHAGLFLLAFLATTPAAPGMAQTAVGTVRTTGVEGVARGAWVTLIDSLGQQQAAILTDTAGRFLLRAPAGRYRLRAQLIGHADANSEPFDLPSGGVWNQTLFLEERALPLAAITVEAERHCEASPEAGAAAILWDEVRKALNAVRQTGRAGLVSYRIRRYERTFSLSGIQEREREDTLISRGSRPFSTPPPAELAAKGYVQGREALSFFAPDAEVLLSDGFAATHCFRVRPGRDETAALVGLGFEPNADRNLPDVEGTLWIDTATAALRFMEFGYSGIDFGPRTRDLGGRVEFRRLPSGAWIVDRWWIRGPVLVAPRTATSGLVARRTISGFMEAGAEVFEILSGVSRPPAGSAGRARQPRTDRVPPSRRPW